MDINRPQAIFFDLDETLLDDNRSYDQSIARVCTELGSAYPEFAFDNLFEVYRRISTEHWAEVADQVMSGARDGQSVRLEAWGRALLACDCRDETIASRALASYSRHRLESYALFDDARVVLEELSGEFEFAVITNGAASTQWEKVRQLGLDAICKAVLVSGEVGVAKPDSHIFRLALERLGVAASTVWHVGDSLNSDVAGAQNAGLTSIYLNRNGTARPADAPEPRHEIRSLLEVPALVGLR